MGVDMAPPHKRRKLLDSSSSAMYETERSLAQPTKCLTHEVQNVEHTFSSSFALGPPQRIDEVHLQIQRYPVVADLDQQRNVQRRQVGTGVSSSSAASSSTLSVSSGDFSSTLTTTSAEVTSSSSLNALSILESSLVDSSSSDAGSTSTSDSTPSETTALSSSSADSTDSGFIGVTPTSASATITPSTAVSNSSISSSTAQSISATVIPDSSTTFTSSVTFNASSTDSHTSTATTSSRTGSDTSLPAFVYLATLSNGDVESITRSSKPYVTTFPDGESSTIAPFSGSMRVTTDPEGKTSTFLETTMISPTTAGQSTITSAVTVDGSGGAGAGAGAGTVVVVSTSTSSSHHMAGGSGGSASSTPPAGTIAGGVVGGAAGLAVILLIAMVLLRWYKRRAQQGHQALPPSSAMSPEPDQQSRGPGMAERAGLMPLVGAVPSLFRHHDRSPVEPTGSERGFTRVSGRKLPSAFSEGMTGPPPSMPLTDPNRNLSSTSFYRDSTGFYGGDGESASSGDILGGAGHRGGGEGGGSYEEMTLSPGPQRRPTVHAGGPYVIAPHGSHGHTPIMRSDTPASPHGTASSMGALGRSETPSSADGNRSSRFTEEV